MVKTSIGKGKNLLEEEEGRRRYGLSLSGFGIFLACGVKRPVSVAYLDEEVLEDEDDRTKIKDGAEAE